MDEKRAQKLSADELQEVTGGHDYTAQEIAKYEALYATLPNPDGYQQGIGCWEQQKIMNSSLSEDDKLDLLFYILAKYQKVS